MKIKILALLLLLSAGLLPQAQTAATGKKLLQKVESAAAGSTEQTNRINEVLQEYVNKQWIAGAAAIVIKDGKVIYYNAVGYDDLAAKTPLRKDAIFRIASQTKAVTSVAVMQLFEQGKILLDDPVSKYIPEFKNQRVIDKYNAADTTYTTVLAKREITIRDLLTHTSGLDYAQIGSGQMNAIYYKAGVVGGIGVGKILLADKMKLLGSLPLAHQPGEKWTYGLNTDLLGYLVEVVSGQTLDQYFKQHIFEPLQMQDTYFYLPTNKQARLAKLHTEDKDKKAINAPAKMNINGDFIADYPKTEGTYFSGGGGLASTAQDYAQFMQMLLNGGTYNGKRILSNASIRMMTEHQTGDIKRNGNKFGLGFEITSDANAGKSPLNPGSYFWGGMFSSTYWIDPKEKLVAQLFLQQYPNTHWEIHEKFKALVYAAINN